MTAVALMPIAEEADAAVAYAEGTVSWNIKMMLMTQGKSQTALADALGVQRAAISKKIRGSVSWSLADLVRAADFLDTDISALLDDSLMKQLQGMSNRKATGNTPMASNELLRLGLNQRPSD
ncbi:putative transcriptional regulator [Bifidobacterium longum subsp. longum]|uniref:helix-turn-helix domain-containing protein n=1 Tax=Bifidobacterium longum TaxID=216816 RepID=UPI0010D3DB33|nr:putative transcriptional regulator [Bifidobacterium longum subsp. longum]